MPGLLPVLMRAPMSFERRMLGVRPGKLVAYWPLDEASGTVARDASGNGRTGAYKAAGEPAPGLRVVDGRGWAFTCPAFDATNDYVNIYSASLNAGFSGSEGSLVAWCKMASAAAWNDGVGRRIITISGGSGNELHFRKDTSGTIPIAFASGGTVKSTTLPNPNTAHWLMLGMTWSVAANAWNVYVDGVPAIAQQTGAGAWAGTLTATGNVIGASSTSGALPWAGNLAHVAIWSEALTAAQMARIAGLAAVVVVEGDSLALGFASRLGPLLTRRSGLRSIATAGERLDTMAGQIATQLRPLHRPAEDRNIAVLLGGTNDAGAGASGATIYSRLEAWHVAARGEGFQTVALSILPRGDNASYNTAIGDANTLLRADNSFADAFIDTAARAELSDPLNTTYFDADKVHLTATGYEILAGMVQAGVDAR